VHRDRFFAPKKVHSGLRNKGVSAVEERQTTHTIPRRALLLFVVGCGISSEPDTDAARENVRSFYSSPAISLDITLNEEPEYATIPKLPKDHLANSVPDIEGVRSGFRFKEPETGSDLAPRSSVKENHLKM